MADFAIFVLTVFLGAVIGWLMKPQSSESAVQTVTVYGTPRATTATPVSAAPRTGVPDGVSLPRTREMSTQSMVTYKRKWSHAEFRVLRESEHGAWRGDL